MSLYFLDSSALVKRYVTEAGSEAFLVSLSARDYALGIHTRMLPMPRLPQA